MFDNRESLEELASNRQVSLANSLGVLFMAFGRSLMCSKKSNGPSFEPWATPHEMGRSDEFTPLMQPSVLLCSRCSIRRIRLQSSLEKCQFSFFQIFYKACIQPAI